MTSLRSPSTLSEVYAALRDTSPIIWSEEERCFLVTRYVDVSALLRDPALSSAITPGSFAEVSLPVIETYLSVLRRQLDLIDPPRHTDLRKVFAHAFGPGQFQRLERFAGRWTADRVCRLPRSFDVMTEIARPLPLATVLELLGVPPEQRPTFHEHVTDFVTAIADPVAAHARAAGALASLRVLLSDALARSDLDEGGLIAIVRGGLPHEIDLEDLLANAILMVAAGHTTTANLIGNGALLLLTHPEQRAIVAERPVAWSTAVEEMLRFESPIQIVRRIASAPFELAGQAIAAGDEVALVLGAANRDPAAFADAHQFHVRRTPNRHLAFGAGGHLCLGAQLARLQAHAALAALFSSSSIRAVSGQPEWIDSTVYRGLSRLVLE